MPTVQFSLVSSSPLYYVRTLFLLEKPAFVKPLVQSLCSTMQHVKFSSIDDFLAYLPAHEKAIVEVLRDIVLQSIPDCTEKLSYNVPYYYRYSRICFIWPASVPWGRVPLRGVQLGFCHGNLLYDDKEYLDRGNRKQVYTKVFTKVRDITADDHSTLHTYLVNAVLLDTQLHANKASRSQHN